MSSSVPVLALLLLAAAQAGRGSRRGLGGITGALGNRVIEEVDVDAVVRRIDLDALLARIDLDALLARIDLDALLARIDLDALVARIDLDAVLDRVEVDRLLDRVDVDRLLDRVEVDRLLDRVDVDRLLDRVEVDRLLDRADLDRLLSRVDVDALLAEVDLEAVVRRAGIPELITESTGQAANSALDLARRQLVAVDVAALHLVQRLLRREPGALPPGPPLLQRDVAGVVQDPQLSRSRTEARIQVSGFYAGPLSRLLALATDIVGSTAAFTGAALATSWLLAVTVGVDLDSTRRSGLAWAVALAGWSLLWWWGSVAVSGRTPAMAIVGLKVVRRDGAPITSGRALVRTLLLPLSIAVFGLGFVLLLLDPERRALHDRLAGAAVVYDWGGRPAELPTPLSRWLLERAGEEVAAAPTGAGAAATDPAGPTHADEEGS